MMGAGMDYSKDHGQWVAMAGAAAAAAPDDDNVCESRSCSDQSSMESSSISNSDESSSDFNSSELVEDATSSSSSTLSSSPSPTTTLTTNGPLYELSELMTQLPIKRGLSKFYQGKSQSYTSLASVKSVEDLAKKGNKNNNNNYGCNMSRSKMKSCKSYGWVLDGQKYSYSPKATISKKASRGSLLSSSSAVGKSRSGALMGGCRPPSISVVQDNF